MRQKVARGNPNKSGLLVRGIIGLWILMMGSDVYADVIVSNLAGTDDINFGGTDIYAQSFTTDAQLYRLDNITINVATFVYDDGSSASGVEVKIWDSGPSESTPGTVIGSFNIPSLPLGGFGDTTFLPSTEIFLNASTTYWIATTHSSTHGGAFQFQGTASAATGPGTMGSLLKSDDGGLSWHSPSPLDMKLEINGTVVPAPTAVILGILGLSTAAIRLRRRRDLDGN
jgi:hypothetical protein